MAIADDTRTLPYDWYVDPAVLRLEQERVFRRFWQYAGRADQAADTGAYFTTRAGDVPVVVARGRDGELRGFVNVCRHRGSVVCEGEGRRETLQCPYHAWTYDLDGSLRTAPRSELEEHFDRETLGLRPVSVAGWGPFVFVNPDADAAPLAETLGDLPELVAAAGIDVDALAFHHRAHSAVDANWKVCCENFLECYHCQVAHPGFSKVVDVSRDAYVLDESRWFSSQFGPVRERPRGDFDPAGDVPRGQFHFLFPNVAINVMPGRPNLSIGPVRPAGPERTERFLDYFFRPEEDETWIADLLEFDDQVGREDAVLVERVQRGLRSGMLDGGRLMTDSERLIAHFGRLLVEQLGA
jgi:choline monooxygenase